MLTIKPQPINREPSGLVSLRLLLLLVQLAFGLLLVAGVAWAFVVVVGAPLLAMLVLP